MKTSETEAGCVYCGTPTSHACRIYGEAICLVCADERDLFDGENIIAEDARDEFIARCMRDEK